MANVGLGSFGYYGGYGGHVGTDPANQFYDNVGQLAMEYGVMVNLVTIAG